MRGRVGRASSIGVGAYVVDATAMHIDVRRGGYTMGEKRRALDEKGDRRVELIY